MVTSILEPRPADVESELAALRAALERVVPPKQPDNLLVGTWNVRCFGGVHYGWRSGPGDSPRRDLSNVACIAEVVRRFDVMAIQEVRGDAQGFRVLAQVLGEGWSYLVTDVCHGRAGNGERLAFVYDRERVRLSGLACELVVAAEDAGLPPGALVAQFARTPYALSFVRGSTLFTLAALHVLYGTDIAGRQRELEALAGWLARWAGADDPWGTNLLALGDFNIDRQGDPLYQAFTSTGLRPAPGLSVVPRTIFDDPDPAAPPDHRHFYDQIAWFTGEQGSPELGMAYRNAGMFDTTGGLIPATTLQDLAARISDHYPLWCEFTVP